MGPLNHCARVGLLGLVVGAVFFAGAAASGTDLDHMVFQTIRRNDTQALRSLLRQGAPLHLRTDDGTTPLLYAALRGSARSVELLLSHGADPNAANGIGATPLLWGARDPEKVRLLLEHGADPDLRSALGNTPLLAASAAAEGSRSAELLLAAGADTDTVNRRGATALANAAFTGSVPTIRLLLAHGAEVNSRRGRAVSPFLLAVERGDREVVELFLRHGADPNESDGNFAGRAVNYALLEQKPEVAELLISRGGDVSSPTPVGSVPPIVLAAYTEIGDTSIARLLLGRGVDVNAANSHAETALTWARRRGHEDLMEILRKAGATEPESARKKKEIPRRRIRLHAGNQDRVLKDAIGKSLKLLARSSDVFLKNRESCVSCHHQNLPGVAMAWARDRGFEIDQGAVDRMVDRQVRSWKPRVDNAYELDRPVPVPPRFLGWGLLGFAAVGYPRDDLTDAMVWYLAAIQETEGYWISGLLRPPMGGSEILATSLAMRALQLYPLEGREEELAGRVGRARSWLLAAQPRIHQERVFRILALSWSGSSAEDLRDDVAGLLAEQREDGGWAQLPGMDSDAWATGQTLVALATAGDISTSHPAYQRGMTFLLSTQFDDGSWFVKSRTWPFQPHFDSRFPHGRDQWISAPATAWATMALTLAVRPFADVVVGERASREGGDVAGDDGEGAGTRGEGTEAARIADRRTPPASSGGASREPVSTDPASRVDFIRSVQPVLERSCLGCHAGERPKSNLRLTTRALLLKGGDSGESAIVPGQGGESLLIRVVSGQVEDLEMPPLGRRARYPALTPEEIGQLRAWIDQGAAWPDGVALEPSPPANPAPRAAESASASQRDQTTGGGPSRSARFAP